MSQPINEALPQAGKDLDADVKVIASIAQARKNFQFHNAKDLLQNLLKRRPKWDLALKELVNLYFDTDNYSDALKIAQRIIDDNPKDEWALLQLAKIHLKKNNVIGEIEALKKISKLKFNELAMKRLFELQKTSGDLTGALETLRLFRKNADTIDLEVNEAKLLNLTGEKAKAKAICKKLLDKKVLHSGALELWVNLHLVEANEPQTILDTFLPLSKSKEGKQNGFLFVGMSRALHRMDKHHEAIEQLKHALSLPKPLAYWWYDISLLQRQMGKIDESQLSLKNCLKLDPLNSTAIRVFGVEHKYKEGDEAFQEVHYAHAFINEFNDQRKVELHFALAKAFEDIGQLSTAFKHYKNAGDLQEKLTPYNHGGASAALKITRDRVKRANYENFPLPRAESSKPVFILGMPRSGTSLVEQVISSHEDVFGAGELKLLHRVVDGIAINNRVVETKSDLGTIVTYIPGVDNLDCRKMDFKERGEFYVRAVESIAKNSGMPDAKRIVDKMPGNYFWAGLIPFILPNAKIIHTQRHPLDNCLSLYRIFFPDGMPWSYNLVNLGKVYKTYYEHMKHWEAALPPNFMLTVNYEVMVNDFENHARKIVDHLGIEWNDACLRFYENERSVKTASLNQVRQPIYTSSVGRWKKYEDHLKPLIKELGPLVEEYGEMIAAKISAIKAK